MISVLAVIAAVMIALVGASTATADVSGVSVSADQQGTNHSFTASLAPTGLNIHFYPSQSLGGSSTITVKGPTGTQFSGSGDDYMVQVYTDEWSSSQVVSAATTSDGGSTVLLAMNPVFGAPAGSHVIVRTLNPTSNVATATLPIKAGPYVMDVATSAEPNLVMSSPFNVLAAGFHDLTLSSGGGQTVAAGGSFAPVVALAVDQFENPVSGVSVDFSAPDSGPSTPTVLAPATSGADGLATSGSFSANTAVGNWSMHVSATSGPAFDVPLTNVAAAPATATLLLAPASLPADGVATTVATTTVEDAFGNPISGAHLKLTASGPGTLPQVGPVDDVGGGSYTATIQASKTGGEFTIKAEVTGSPAATGTATLTQRDVTSPTVKITKHPKKTIRIKSGKAKVTLKLRASEASTFQCKVDRKAYRSCRSPLKLKLGKGRHTVSVRATDKAGNQSKPVKATFKVVRRK